MSNVIAYAADWADEARAAGQDYNAVRALVQQRSLADHPTHLGMVDRINYLEKSDRYVVKTGNGDTFKLTNDAAIFLIRENAHPSRSMRPSVYAHFNDSGEIDSVLLLFISREGA